MARRSIAVLALASTLALGSGSAHARDPLAHYGDALVQVQAWPEQVFALGLDVWTHRSSEPLVVARVTAAQRPALDASGYDYVVLEPDLGPQVHAEAERLAAVPDPVAGGLDPSFHADYRDFATVLARLDGMVGTFPARASLVEVGVSLEGRPIRGVRITNAGADDRPVIVVQACQHAREWIAVAATMWAAEQLAGAVDGGYIDDLLDQAEIVVVPVANPDGYVYSWEVERFWRKNRRDGLGVDLNRNWGVGWGGEGSSPDLMAENYRGAAPFSEPESAAMRDFLAADPDVITLFDVHSFGQLLLYPWGFDYVDSADDMLFAQLVQGMSDAMFPMFSTWYQPLQSSDFYPAAGNAIDWAYGVHGHYAVTVELRPALDDGAGFVLGPEHIVPTGEELLAAIADLVESTVALGPGSPGDSGGEVPGDSGDSDGTTGDSGGRGTTSGFDLDTTAAGEAEGDSTHGTGVGGSGSGSLPAGTTGPGGDTEVDRPGAGEDEVAGCSCRAGERGPSAAWLLVIAAAIRRRGRRTSVTRSADVRSQRGTASERV